MNGKHLKFVLGVAVFIAFVQAIHHCYIAYLAEHMLGMLARLGSTNEQLRSSIGQHISESVSNFVIAGCLLYVFWCLRRQGTPK